MAKVLYQILIFCRKFFFAVVDHYDTSQSLGLTAGQKSDIVEYLKSL